MSGSVLEEKATRKRDRCARELGHLKQLEIDFCRERQEEAKRTAKAEMRRIRFNEEENGEEFKRFIGSLHCRKYDKRLMKEIMYWKKCYMKVRKIIQEKGEELQWLQVLMTNEIEEDDVEYNVVKLN